MKLRHLFASVFFGAMLLSTSALAQVRVLVASPNMGEFYARTVIVIAQEAPNGMMAGFIINRQSPMTLAQVFPSHEGSKKLNAPIFLGGPMNVNTVWALSSTTPAGNGAVTIQGDKYTMVMQVDMVDALIDSGDTSVRYVAGLVIWQPGEFQLEQKQSFWLETSVSVEELLATPAEALWEKLSGPLTQRGNMI